MNRGSYDRKKHRGDRQSMGSNPTARSGQSIQGRRKYQTDEAQITELIPNKESLNKPENVLKSLTSSGYIRKRKFDTNLTLIKSSEDITFKKEKKTDIYDFEGDPCNKCGNFTLHKKKNELICLSCDFRSKI